MTYTNPDHRKPENERTIGISQTNGGSNRAVALVVILALIVVGAGIWVFTSSSYKASLPSSSQSTTTPDANQTAPANPPAQTAPAKPAESPAQPAPATPPAQ